MGILTNGNPYLKGKGSEGWDMALSPFDRHWPKIKENIFPRMSPNNNVWATLFELARVELGFADNRIPAKEEDEEAFANFFRHNAGGMDVLSHDKQHAMVYLRIYKGGNNQIMRNIQATFGPTNVSFWMFGLTSNYFSKSSMSRARTNTTCVVTAIRDPVDHFLSAYNEVMYRRGYKNGTVTQFEQFVSDFIAGPVSNRIYRSRIL